jgi:predicted dehydrogenase
VDVEPLISASYPITDAGQAYASLQSGDVKPLMVLLTYADDDSRLERSIPTGIPVSRTEGIIRIAVIGAGAFARANHLPNLAAMKDRFAIQTVASRSGHTAAAIAKQFGAVNASTDYDEVLADPDVDAVIIATRHHLHAGMALRALQAGKHVLVEKPLCLNTVELEAIDQWVSSRGEQASPILMTGYNRRFSPYAERLAKLVAQRSGAFMFDYRMNAGHIPRDHWVHGPEGGGRNLGEACHIYDLFTFLADAEIVLTSAVAIAPKSSDYARNDNFVATFRFADGSLASLTYSASGSTDYAKETAEIFVDGKTAVLTDYKQLEVYGGASGSLTTSRQDKGLNMELIAFADGINQGHWPIPWWQQKQVARMALEIENQLNCS